MIITYVPQPICSSCLTPMNIIGRKQRQEKLDPVTFMCTNSNCEQNGHEIKFNIKRADSNASRSSSTKEI